MKHITTATKRYPLKATEKATIIDKIGCAINPTRIKCEG